MGAELDILIWIQDNLRTSISDSFFQYFTHLMDYNLLLFVIGLVLLISKKYRKVGMMIIITGLLVLLVANLLKYGVGRLRPFDVYPIDLLIPAPTSPSFPSTHAAASFALVFIAFLLKNRTVCIVMLCFAFLMAFSRMYLFVHYPSDLLGGVIVGIVCAYLAFFVLNKYGTIEFEQ